MHPLEKISTGTTREAGHQPDGTEYPAWSGQDGKNYGSERGCNSFLNVSFAPIAPQSVTREDHDGISHNLITQENYEFLRDSYFRYAGLSMHHMTGAKVSGKASPTSIMNWRHSWMKRCM